MKKILILLLTMMVLFTGCDKKKEEPVEEPKDKANTNENVIKDQTVGTLEFKNTSLLYKDGMTSLETTITNNSNETTYVGTIDIIVKDIDGNILTNFVGFVAANIKSGDSKTITSYTDIDLSKAFSIEYKLN